MASRFLVALLLLATAPAHAFFIRGPEPVVEFYNVYLGHYFMAQEIAEIVSVESGKAGPGWVRTGFSFDACPVGGQCLDGTIRRVYRFYGTPGLGPNSHFYTADPAESSALDRPGTGWTFEKIGFYIHVPDAAGSCGSRVPVYRLYNQRARFNDSNHRYVTSDAERARMVGLGWADEGVRFCTDRALDGPIKRFAIDAPPAPGLVKPSAQCEDESINLGPCIAVNNLPVPTGSVSSQSADFAKPFFDVTGLRTSLTFVVTPRLGMNAANDVFVQSDAPGTYGIHVATGSRGPSGGSSVNPLYQLSTAFAAGEPDTRFFPFGAYESDAELKVSFNVFVKTIKVLGAGGSAFGHPTLELVDRRSGRHVYFTTLAYGTVDAIPVYVAFDSGTGRPIVGTSFRADSPYIRTFGLPSLPTPSGFVSPHPWGWGGYFEYRMDREEFRRVIDSWRTLVPELSTDPADYFLDNFHFNNEIGGDGEIGIWLQDYQVRLIRR
jgi:hypothetical protein